MTTKPIPMEPVIELTSPVHETLPEALEAGAFTVQFSTPLTVEDYESLAVLVEKHPDTKVRVYQAGTQAPVSDLDFLTWLPHLRRFQCDVLGLRDFSGLRHLRRPQSLALGRTTRSLPVSVLAELPTVRELSVEGHDRGMEALAALRALERLTLRSVTLPDLAVIAGLPQLWWLAVKLGGTRDLGAAASLPLKYLELWQIRGLTDVRFVAELHDLQYLFLQSLKRVEALPSLAPLLHLRRVYLEKLPLRDLHAVAAAPGLREVLLVGMESLPIGALEAFRGHPTMQAVGYGLGSNRRNDAARELLGLPESPGGEFTFS